MIETLLFAGVISFGSYLYITYRLKLGGSSSVAAYVAMVSAVSYIVNCISNALGHFSQAGKLCMYMKSIRDFMECPIEEKVENAILPEGNMGEISFENVLMKSPETENERQTVIDALEKAQFGEVL